MLAIRNIQVTAKELADFIRSKGDAPINMGESIMNNGKVQPYEIPESKVPVGCGCLFLQYARSIFPEENRISCGTEISRIRNEEDEVKVEIEFPIVYKEWCQKEINKVTKFSDIKIPEGL